MIEPRPSSRGLPYESVKSEWISLYYIYKRYKRYSRHRQWYYNYRRSEATCHAHYITIDSFLLVLPQMRSLTLASFSDWISNRVETWIASKTSNGSNIPYRSSNPRTVEKVILLQCWCKRKLIVSNFKLFLQSR